MTLLGLLRADSAGLRSPIDIEATVDRLLGETTWVNSIGDLGLLLWLCASTSDEYLERFRAKFDLFGALKHYRDAQCRLTMELSWFLTGLAHAGRVSRQFDCESLAHEVYGLIRANQGRHGLFAHMSKWHSLAGVVRGRVGSFADQVYPILALAHFSQTFGHRESRESALRCAHAICRLQGPLGQWWWHYDSATGRVVEHYPVYSVHQHGMAPMALLALEEMCGAEFRQAIHAGLEWISGGNELRLNLEDASLGVAWRCIRPARSNAYATGIRALIGKEPRTDSLHVLYECRPYELGWLLYALAQPGATTVRG